jgi:hypothetical protein
LDSPLLLCVLGGAGLLVTIYRGARAPVPIAVDDLEWPDLCDEVEAMAAIEYADKLAMLAIGPHRLSPTDRRTDLERSGKPPAAGAYRHLSNVEAVTLLVLDVDRVDDLAGLLERAAELAPTMVYESPSSTAEAPRVRVLAPVNREILVSECARTRFAFAELLGLDPHAVGVDGAKDAAKLFFVGRLAGTEPRQCWRFE